MKKIYKYIIDEKKQDLHIKIKYINILTKVLKLWLKCSAIQSIFYSYILIKILFNRHQNVDC